MIRAFSTSFLFNVTASAAGSIAIVMVIAVLEPSRWGQSAALLGAGQLLGSALSFGSPIERIRRYSNCISGAERQAIRDSFDRVVTGAILLILALLASVVSWQAGAVMAVAVGVFMSLGATNYWISQKRFAMAGSWIVGEKLVVLAITALASIGGLLNESTLPLAQGFSGAAAGVAALFALRPSLRTLFIGFRPGRLLRQWKGVGYLGIASVAPSILLLDSTVVLFAAGSTEAGLFSVGSKLVSPLSVLASTLVAVLLPFMAAPGQPREWPRLRPGGIVVGLLFVAGLAFVFVSAEGWVPWIFGGAYSGAVTPVRFYLLNVAFILVTRVLATVLQAWGHDRFVAIAVASQCSVGLAGIYLGAELGGASLAALSVAITNAMLVAVLLWRVRALSGSRLGDAGS